MNLANKVVDQTVVSAVDGSDEDTCESSPGDAGFTSGFRLACVLETS